MPPIAAIKCQSAVCSLSSSRSLSPSLNSLLQRMASNDNNDKCKLEEEVESSMAKKRLWIFDDDVSDNDSTDSPEETEEEEEMKEEVSSDETSMNNQLDTSEEKLQAKHICGIVFGNDGDTTSPSSEPCSPESRQRSDEDSSDDDNDDF
jgi:hypothetical protein